MKNSKCSAGNKELGLKATVYHVGPQLYHVETEGTYKGKKIEMVRATNLSSAFSRARHIVENPGSYI